jgi:hypothetical protein
MDPHDTNAGGIREGEPPLASSKATDAASQAPDISKSKTWIAVFWISTSVIALSLLGSCLAAPFLVPFFQLYLIPPIIGAAVLGVIGGFCRRWWLTGLVWGTLLSAYVGYDVATNGYGYRSLWRTYVMHDPPRGFMYWHSWEQLFQITIIPLTLAIAALLHGWVAEFQRRRSQMAPPPA